MSAESRYADWIAVHAGQSDLRAWALAADGSVRAELTLPSDGAMPEAPAFEAKLLDMIAPWLGQGSTSVLACGLTGLADRPDAITPVPAKPAERLPIRVSANDPRLDLLALPGLSQANPPDLLLGEETEVAGFLAGNPGFDGVLCLVGPRTVWVQISAEEIVSFQTAMTGEFFDILAGHSTISAAVASTGMDAEAFADAVSDTLSRPERLSQRLAALRGQHVLQQLDPSVARSRLFGALIGAELAAMRPYWLGQQVALAGPSDMVDLYARALDTQGVSAPRHASDGLALAGLARAWFAMQEHAK